MLRAVSGQAFVKARTLAAETSLNVSKFVRIWAYLVWIDSSQCPLSDEHNARHVSVDQGGYTAVRVWTTNMAITSVTSGFKSRLVTILYEKYTFCFVSHIVNLSLCH